MSPVAVMVAGLMWVTSVGATFWFAYGAGKDAELAIQAREDRSAAVSRESAARAISDVIPKITVKHQTIKQELEREILTNPVYLRAECDTGPASLQRFNAGIPGATAAAPDSGALPASGSSR